ncbi:tetratricopeptide repeat protein [Nonomuraea sp. KC401]|uniref:tetratricopeptide repeat protein n=1 Tax=unclassified Nonomuraea TaxID=2593643 RepID=UPI0010FEAE49|nr:MULTISPECIES: tetratricopeptide repeat protein [unclassified Nonomuraea]NBE98720.1 tetratricopeptide repeat protein [Nonomuraea sp. K271]TLF60006.1 tetratricopeptide repeat protein [Nonomuraea sp. KC401]
MADFSKPGSLYGAVDLGARKQALEAQARREAAGPQAAAASVVDVTEETFTSEVIDKSMTLPVVLDLWSPRSPGSVQLSPVLEKVVGDLGGKAVLAKVNVDASPQIAQALRVQAVPTVLAIFQGQAVTGFQQVLPEQEVRRWLDELMGAVEQFYQANPDARPAEAGEPAEQEEPSGPPADPDMAAAEQAIDRGDFDAAIEAYQRLLARAPGNEDAKMGLAGVALLKRTSEADPADVQRRAQEDPADLDAQLLAADFEMMSGAIDQAFERVIAVVKRTSGDERDKARRHLLGLFEALPAEDPSLAKARRALASALF